MTLLWKFEVDIVNSMGGITSIRRTLTKEELLAIIEHYLDDPQLIGFSVREAPKGD